MLSKIQRIVLFFMILYLCGCSVDMSNSEQAINEAVQKPNDVIDLYGKLLEQGYFTIYEEDKDLIRLLYNTDDENGYRYYVYSFDSDYGLMLYDKFDSKDFLFLKLDDGYYAFDGENFDVHWRYDDKNLYYYDGEKETKESKSAKDAFYPYFLEYKRMASNFVSTSLDQYAKDVKAAFKEHGEYYLLDEAFYRGYEPYENGE